MHTFDFQHNDGNLGRVVKANSYEEAKAQLENPDEWLIIREIDDNGNVLFDPFAGIWGDEK